MADVIALIPARGGSKGIHRKNLQPLGGTPLLVYAIRSASRAKHVSRTFLSTEDEEIAKVGQDLGVEVIHRPTEFSSDEAPMIEVVLHALDEIGERGVPVECLVLLQPTSPLRTAEDIDEAISLFLSQDGDSVVSVSRTEHPPHYALEMQGPYLQPILGRQYLRMRRQDLPEAYLPNGAIFVSTPEVLQKQRTFYTERTLPYLMPRARSIDIDTEEDLRRAEALLEKEGDQALP